MIESLKVVIYIICFVLLLRFMLKEKKVWVMLLCFVCVSIIVLNTSVVDTLSEPVKVIWAVLTLAGAVSSYFLMTKPNRSNSRLK